MKKELKKEEYREQMRKAFERSKSYKKVFDDEVESIINDDNLMRYEKISLLAQMLNEISIKFLCCGGIQDGELAAPDVAPWVLDKMKD
jgi:hypothetical protein